jgi:hypothetical protein
MVYELRRRENFNMGTDEETFPEQVPRLLPKKRTKGGIVQNVSKGG